MLPLFLLDPNRPWMKTMGASFAVASFSGSNRSYAILTPLSSSVVEKARRAFSLKGCCTRKSPALRANIFIAVLRRELDCRSRKL